MPPEPKQRDLLSATGRHQQQDALPLLQLPELQLTLIAKQISSSSKSGHPMLAVSRGSRDAVLRGLAKIKLTTHEAEQNQEPSARLLHRACCEAPPGLGVELDLTPDTPYRLLATLFQPALGSPGGWRHVHKLKVTTTQSAYLHLLGPAMPCLKYLDLDLRGGDIGDGGLLMGLQGCLQLEVVRLQGIAIYPTLVHSYAAALARLPALRELGLQMAGGCSTDPAGFAGQLTCLTSLHLRSRPGKTQASSSFTVAACNPALQVLSVCEPTAHDPTAAQLQHLLTSCQSLTCLDLGYFDISQDALEVILTYGTRITSLRAFTIRAHTSFADRQCGWKRLGLAAVEYYPTVLHWANLPLKGLEDLEIWDPCHDGSLAALQLPLSSMHPDQLAALLLQATTNLAASPAWQADPESCIALYFDPSGGTAHSIRFTPQQRIQLLEALAPLGGPHVTKFESYIMGAVFEWGRPELQALGHSLNSSQLSELELSYCHLAAEFWSALDEVLPSLATLCLNTLVACSAADVAGYCSQRKDGLPPLTLRLGDDVYQELLHAVGGAELQAALTSQGASHVTVVHLPNPLCC